MGPKYYLQGEEFVIENYNQAKPFASFLPGIAGLRGRPLWAFYVNRGQCIASFGQTSKEQAIMEFYPANTSYRRTPLEGFRTFVKTGGRVYEPFRVPCCKEGARKQAIYTSMHELRIEELSDESVGLRFEAVYFTIPHENFPALARILTIENVSGRALSLEVIDGMPKICPYGLNEFFMKHMSRTIEAWMEVSCLERMTPFYRLRVDAADTAETRYITSGNFYLSHLTSSGDRPRIIVDPSVVFGDNCDLSYPGAFAGDGFRVPKVQVDRNTTPSAFSHCSVGLAAGASSSILSLSGHAASEEELRSIDSRICGRFFEAKRDENRRETSSRASSVSVFSALPVFDMYTRQTNLDNILRGGCPIQVRPGKPPIYVFNRKHGDLERDYNNFVLNPEFYSQGNGNFRDTNQNRRMSVWIEPAVGRKDIKDFYNLIQLDGYNPLVIKGDRFQLRDRAAVAPLARRHFGKGSQKAAAAFLAGSFTLGELIKFADSNGAKDTDALIGDVVGSGSARIDAEHGEGFWTDHWTYNLDLVESYLALYPEEERELLFRERAYAFFDNPHRLLPRKERVVPGPGGKARQYHGVRFDQDKARLIRSRRSEKDWVRARNGRGDVYRCTLAAKMLVIAANKIATLDASGIGIEMEADKPAWCDSLNGLPALFGSSLSETIELARLVRFLRSAFASAAGVSIPSELAVFISGLTRLLNADARSSDKSRHLRYWEKANSLKEKYRDAVRLGVSGRESLLEKEEAIAFLSLAFEKLEDAIRRGCSASGVPYTYFTNDLRCVGKGKVRGPAVSKPLPLSLEACVHAMKLSDGVFDARSLYECVRSSELYDGPLGMYKLNAPLENQPLEIGRSRAFTPGWLENESIWLHMEYKYLLELLKNGLYGEFYRDMKSALVPFMDAARYGRSTLENSSFIASSAFFNEGLRGNGFVARLSGATAEFLQILLIMNLGRRPFTVSDSGIVFAPSPVLEGRFFTDRASKISFDSGRGAGAIELEAGSYAFSLFSRTLVVYENPKRMDTFGPGGVKCAGYKLRYRDGREERVDGPALGEPYSKDLRDGSMAVVSIKLG